MTGHESFPAVFQRLRAILEPYAPQMRVVHDTDSTFYLDTNHTMRNGQPLFFGSVQIRKNYVSFYVMPVYAFPDLLDGIGDLRKRMQGKSCFNFKALEDDQVAALKDLVRRGYDRYAAEGMLA